MSQSGCRELPSTCTLLSPSLREPTQGKGATLVQQYSHVIERIFPCLILEAGWEIVIPIFGTHQHSG